MQSLSRYSNLCSLLANCFHSESESSCSCFSIALFINLVISFKSYAKAPILGKFVVLVNEISQQSNGAAVVDDERENVIHFVPPDNFQ